MFDMRKFYRDDGGDPGDEDQDDVIGVFIDRDGRQTTIRMPLLTWAVLGHRNGFGTFHPNARGAYVARR